MQTDEFLDSVITSESGKLLLCIRNHAIPWNEQFFEWPSEKGKLLDRLNIVKETSDVYFTSHLFASGVSLKENVRPTRTIQADLDAADEYPIEPSILVQTSPNRYQGYWLLKYDIESLALEMLSKRLTYNIDNSDHSGWTLGHRVRLPGTLNFKYNNGPHPVEVISASMKQYAPEDFELLPAIPQAVLTIHDNDFVEQADSIKLEMGAFELLNSVRAKIPHTVYQDYINKTVSSDRSEALWSLMCSLFESGLERDQVFWLAKYSVNNKYDTRFNANQELAKDVQRAEKKVKVKRVDIRSAIDVVRNRPTPTIPGAALQKRRQIFQAVRLAMSLTGRPVKVIAGLPYFIPHDTGRPIALTPGSEYLRALIHLQYGINSADPEYKYIHDGIIDDGITFPNEIQESTLSYFDGTTLYVHTGRKDVIKIDASSITITENASCGVLFPWHEIFEPFTLNVSTPYPDDWANAVFGDLHNTSNMEPREAKALLKSWLIFSLFRSQISTRPILAFLGPPGSSKSTIPHRIYALLYARRLAVSGVSGAADFDMSSSKLPIYCIDNLDSYIGWIIDKLAQAIGNIDILKRKLFTDVEVIRQRRQAMLVVTAHNPKFTREDVTSRLLLITLDEIEKTRLADETEMINHIIDNRPALWAAILLDTQRVLQTPRIKESTVKWRIQDFASIGEWIAVALGYKDDFNSGLAKLLTTQSDTILQQEEILTTALLGLDLQGPVTASDLWNLLLVQVGGNQGAFIHAYKSSVKLTQKLITMRPSLRFVLDIEQVTDQATRMKKWSIKKK